MELRCASPDYSCDKHHYASLVYRSRDGQCRCGARTDGAHTSTAGGVRRTLVHMGTVMTLRAPTFTPSATPLFLSLAVLCVALSVRTLLAHISASLHSSTAQDATQGERSA